MSHLHAGLVLQSLVSDLVHLRSEELKIGANLLSSLTGILDLETGEPELEVESEPVVHLEGLEIESPSCKENELPYAPVVLKPLVSLFVKVALISVEFLLRIYVLQQLGLVPPSKLQMNWVSECIH